jgi:hypothetical protein
MFFLRTQYSKNDALRGLSSRPVAAGAVHEADGLPQHGGTAVLHSHLPLAALLEGPMNGGLEEWRPDQHIYYGTTFNYYSDLAARIKE